MESSERRLPMGRLAILGFCLTLAVIAAVRAVTFGDLGSIVIFTAQMCVAFVLAASLWTERKADRT